MLSPILGVPIKDLPSVLDAIYLDHMEPTLTSIRDAKKYLSGLSSADQGRLIKSLGTMFRPHIPADGPLNAPMISVAKLVDDGWAEASQAAVQTLKHISP
jgi:hypothetical protein